MSLGRQVGRALLWTSLESFGLSGLSLICLVVFARCLSPSEFGVAAVAIAIVQGVGVPTELLFHDVLIQRREVEDIHINSAFTVAVLLGLLSCAGCWLLSGVIERVTGTPQLGDVLKWMSLSLIGSGFASVLTAVQRRRLEFRAVALRSLIGRAGSAAIAIALALSGAGVWSLVVQQVLLVWLGTATLWWLTRERPRFEFAWRPTRQLLAFGWLSTSFHLLNVLVPRLFMVLVGSYLGSADAGFLSLAFRGVDMLRELMTGAVAHLAAPAFARLRDDPVALAAGFVQSTKLTTLATYPVFVGLAVCAPEVLLVVFGPEWVEVTPYFVVVALLALPYFLAGYVVPLLYTLDDPLGPLWQLLVEIAWVVLAMVTFGKLSIAYALGVWASRMLLTIPLGMWLLKRRADIGVTMQLSGALIPALAALGMGTTVQLVRSLLLAELPPVVRLVLSIAVGAAAYLAMLMLVGRDLVRQVVELVRVTLSRRAA